MILCIHSNSPETQFRKSGIKNGTKTNMDLLKGPEARLTHLFSILTITA